MADETGVIGQYDGPNPGSTPADDSDLHQNGGNPWSVAGPHYSQQPLVYPPGAPWPFYDNPPIKNTDNMYHAGSAGQQFGTLDAANNQANDYLAHGDAPASSADSAAVWNDEGFGRSGNDNSV